MRSCRLRSCAIGVAWSLCSAVGLLAAAHTAVPKDAQAELDLAQAAFSKSDWKGVLEHAERAAKLAPRSLETQQRFISDHRFVTLTTLGHKEAERAFEKIRDHYRQEAAKSPRDAFWQVLLGDVQFYEDPKESQRCYVRAVELDPKNPGSTEHLAALQMLAVIAETSGDKAGSHAYYRRAAEAAPEDAEIAGAFAFSFMDSDFESFQKEGLRVVEKFPQSAEAVKVFYWLGSKAPSSPERRKYWQEAVDRYPVAKATEDQRDWLDSVYGSLFTLLRDEDPIGAENFAREAAVRFSGGKEQAKEWLKKYQQQASLNIVRTARQAGDPEAALARIAEIEKDLGPRDRELKGILAYEKALDQAASGQAPAAMETLLARLKDGSDAAEEAAYFEIAKKAGKPEKEAQDMLWKARRKDAKPFKNFTLKDPDGKSVSLDSYRGGLVLVNFWYPSCGPCRGEFPELEKIVRQFQGQPFTVLAINTHPKEGYKVKSFLKANGYTFRALEAPTDNWAEDEYKVRGTPSNFLLDRDGRVVAEPRLYDETTRESLAREIEELLHRAGV